MDSTEVLLPPTLLNPVTELVAPSLPVEVTATPACPWSKIAAAETVSFNDVMTEQLAISLQEADQKVVPQKNAYADDLIGCGEEVTNCSDDYLLAKMLQLEYDKEHDNIIKNQESKYNASNTVKISYGKYLRLPDRSASSDEDDDKDDVLEQNAKHHWHNFEQAEKAFQAVGKSGVSRQGNITTTKHDLVVSGRRNAGKLMELPPGLSTGDGGIFDMKLSNNVYNTLKSHSRAEVKRLSKLHDKREIATVTKALDEKTHLILYKLINNQTLNSYTGCISTGKEACVFHAWSGDLPGEKSSAPEFAIKVFKTTLNEFHNREEYIRGDYRFKNRFGKQNPRKTIHMWAEKEKRNLLRMKDANLPCPDVVTLKKHVLVMSFIGENMVPAPTLKELDLPFEDMTIIYEQSIDIMKNMYSKCKLVHADFSEYNLLWHKDQTWVIDVAQAVEISHPGALDFLLRDCTNVTTFFKKRGVLNVPEPEKLFAEICDQLPKNCQSGNDSKE